MACYVINTSDGKDEKWRCIPQRDDYYECLYHKKEVRRPTQEPPAMTTDAMGERWMDG